MPHVTHVRHRAIVAMPADEKTDPIQVNFFSTEAIEKMTNSLPDLGKQACRLPSWIAGFVGTL